MLCENTDINKSEISFIVFFSLTKLKKSKHTKMCYLREETFSLKCTDINAMNLVKMTFLPLNELLKKFILTWKAKHLQNIYLQ